MKKLTLIVFMAFIALFIYSCTNTKNLPNTQNSLDEERKSSVHSVEMSKIQENTITEKYWKLIELKGEAIKTDENNSKEPHIIFKEENNRMTGTSECNSFNGSYELLGENQIKISQVIATMMACPDMKIERELFSIFEMIDNYTLSADGKYLSLNRARMAPLARFEIVYLR